MSGTVLVKGGCDVDAICFYLRLGNVVKEGSQIGIHGETFYCSAHSEILAASFDLDRRPLSALDETNYYKSQLCSDKCSFSTIVLSIISEGGCGVYFDERGRGLVYGGCDDDATKSGRKYYGDVSHAEYSRFCRDYRFAGRTPIPRAIDNFKAVINHIPPQVRIIFVLGPTTHGEVMEMSPVFADSTQYFDNLNNALRSAFSSDTRVFFVDPNPYIKRAKRFPYTRYFFRNYQTVAHYKRKVYLMMARELHRLDENIKPTFYREICRDVRRFVTMPIRLLHRLIVLPFRRIKRERRH